MAERNIHHPVNPDACPFIISGKQMTVSEFLSPEGYETTQFHILHYVPHFKHTDILHAETSRVPPKISDRLHLPGSYAERAVLENGRAFMAVREYTYRGNPIAFAGFTNEWWQDSENQRYVHALTGYAMMNNEIIRLPLSHVQNEIQEHTPMRLILWDDLSLSLGHTRGIKGTSGHQEVTIHSFCLTTIQDGDNEQLVVGALLSRPGEPIHIESIRTILAHDSLFHPLPPGV